MSWLDAYPVVEKTRAVAVTPRIYWAMAKRKTVAKSAPPGAQPPLRTAPSWAPYITLALIAAAVYANGLSNGFITDDKLQLLGNSLVTDIHKLPHVFGSGVWAFLGYRGNYYRPLQFLLYGFLYFVSSAPTRQRSTASW